MKTTVYILLILLLASFLGSFTLPESDAFIVKVVKNFMVRAKMLPQEKLYLHIDRKEYGAGDSVWFRAYLQNAMTHQPSVYSRYVYVELTDRQDSVWQRVKIRRQDSMFAGYMRLPEGIKQGEYFLRGYSYWMQNAGEDFLFRKQIRVSNVRHTRVLTDVAFEKGPDGEVARIAFRDRLGTPYIGTPLYYLINGKEGNGKERFARTDTTGCIKITFDPAINPYDISLRFGEHASLPFKQRIYIPSLLPGFKIQFFPEGGDLVPGGVRNVAFKAVGTDGLAVEVDGRIFDDLGRLAGTFETEHKGMGKTGFLVESGRKYHAVVKDKKGWKEEVKLPEVKEDGLALQMLVRGGRLVYSIAAADSVPDGLYLLGHCRGKVLLLNQLLGRTSGVLSGRNLPEGINHFLIVDSLGKIYSQRLLFVRGQERPEIGLKLDKSGYMAREKVNLSLELGGNTGGSFSLAVVNSDAEQPDSLSGNILSSLLLTSDLKGYVEEPGYYFNKINDATNYHLDLLLMTQGWTRFEVKEVLEGKLPEPEYFLERGQVISGRVKNFWGNKALGAQLVLLSTSGILRTTTTDSAGRFSVDGITYPDGAQFILQARSRNGGNAVEVSVDEENFMPPHILEPYSMKSKEEEEAFVQKFGGSFYYEDGVKVYMLDEVNVNSRKINRKETYYESVADYKLDSAKIAGLECGDISVLLQFIPGVTVEPGRIARLDKTLLLIVNDMEQTADEVSSILPMDIISISYLNSLQASALFGGGKGRNGALVLELNRNYRNQKVIRVNLRTFKALGYQKPADFYIPPYDVDSVRMAMLNTPDNRITVCWKPSLLLTPGKLQQVSFYTADRAAGHRIILEGILEDGTVCRKEIEF